MGVEINVLSEYDLGHNSFVLEHSVSRIFEETNI